VVAFSDGKPDATHSPRRQACDAQRKPGTGLSSTAKTEVDYLLTRLARTDKRAELKPRLAQAS
jgi:hypothetical protein